jgi:hypothetical protein
MSEEKLYVISEDQIERFGDYVEDDDNHTEGKYKNARGLACTIRSRQLSEEIRKAREDVLDELIEHYEQVIKDGSGITYNHPITYEWMYRGIVIDYLKLLRGDAP